MFKHNVEGEDREVRAVGKRWSAVLYYTRLRVTLQTQNLDGLPQAAQRLDFVDIDDRRTR